MNYFIKAITMSFVLLYMIGVSVSRGDTYFSSASEAASMTVRRLVLPFAGYRSERVFTYSEPAPSSRLLPAASSRDAICA